MLPHILFHHFSRLLARSYYRIKVSGERIPHTGPVLIVANHPNSLLDPALVAWAAGRPVRFLARAPLFDHPGLGWFIRGMGSIPIYRAMDRPELTVRNEDTFRAVWKALAEEGAAVGIFPEGLTHGGPTLAPLKSGAARIALGAAGSMGRTFPIIPVGLTFRAKEEFRSDALALVGSPVEWDDLATGAPNTPETVRTLTHRISQRLHEVTLNLERWEDAPLVEAVEAIHRAEFGGGDDPGTLLRRSREVNRSLALVRQRETAQDAELAREVRRHHRILNRLNLRPQDLRSVPSASVALRWAARGVFFFGFLAPLALLGQLVFWSPQRFIGLVEERLDLSPELRASYKVMGGTVAFLGWAAILAAVAGRMWGWEAAVGVLTVLPLLGAAMLATHGRWGEAVQELKRFFLLRGRGDLRQRLLNRQGEIAQRLHDLRRHLEAGGGEEGELLRTGGSTHPLRPERPSGSSPEENLPGERNLPESKRRL